MVLTLVPARQPAAPSSSASAAGPCSRRAPPTSRTRPNGTGPFTLERVEPGCVDHARPQRRLLGQPAGAAEVTFQYFTDPNAAVTALQDGDADLLTRCAARARWRSSRTTPTGLSPPARRTASTRSATTTRPTPLTDIRVRQAISRAIDKQGILELNNGYGTIIGGPLPPFDPAYEDLTDINAFDPESSRAVAAGGRLRRRARSHVRRAEHLPDEHQRLHRRRRSATSASTSTVQSVEFPTWIDQVFINHDYDLTAVLHVEPKDIGNYANPDYYWQYDSPTVQDLLSSQARTTTDPAESRRPDPPGRPPDRRGCAGRLADTSPTTSSWRGPA